MKHILYLIPGWSEHTSQKEYQELKSRFKNKGYKVVEISIMWRKRVMSEYVDEFLSQCIHTKNNKVSVLGYSFGAMIACISSRYISYTNMYLCSLSPFFKEDLINVPKSWKKELGIRRIKDFSTLSFNEIIEKWNPPTNVYLFFGEEEYHLLIRRVKDAHINIKNSQLISVPNCKHQLSHKNYLEKVKENDFLKNTNI